MASSNPVPPKLLTRAQAWQLLLANVAMPGSGSLMAGRRVGYFQIVLAVIAMAISTVETIRTGLWYIHNYDRLNSSSDPFGVLIELGKHLIGPVVGLGIFVLAILWAVVTSLLIIKNTPKP
jgi:hypothetical protein